MKFIKHPSNNVVLNAPVDAEGKPDENIEPLHATKVNIEGDPYIVSFWMPTPEELSMILQGRPIRLWVAGETVAPIAIDVDPPKIVKAD